ncbi:TetR/AcrR family transcriptional regulator [Brachybacterium phenoliresistens]|uniref:TetR/AcrR family transcriptional regulator n=1 Tax=Brachybacterium phenoliresistens TaxID=396014 RepID=UPI0031DFBE46
MASRDLAGPHRRALLEATVDEFAAAGYQGASLNRIIRAAGISKSSFYHAAGSKAELLDVVVRALVDEIRAQWSPPPAESFADGDFWQQVQDVLEGFAGLVAGSREAALLGRILYLPAAEGDDARSAVLDDVGRWIAAVIAAGRRAGAVEDRPDPAVQAAAAMGLLRGLDEWALAQAGPVPLDAAEVARLLRRLLGA